MAEAPTLLQILDGDASVSVYCPACRLVEDVDVVGLSNRFGAGVRVSRIRFTCRRVRDGRNCRMRRQVTVKGPGNLTLGRPQLWPPQTTVDRS